MRDTRIFTGEKGAVKSLLVRFAVIMLGAFPAFSFASAVNESSAQSRASSVLEVSVQVAGEAVIKSALVEVLHGAPARVASYDDEARTTGFEIELQAQSLPSLAAQGAVLVSAEVNRISGGERTAIANADVGVLPDKLSSLQLNGGDVPVLLEVLLKGQNSYSEEELSQFTVDQCSPPSAGTAAASDALSSCCTRKCADGSNQWMECCGGIFCCTCGACCATP